MSNWWTKAGGAGHFMMLRRPVCNTKRFVSARPHVLAAAAAPFQVEQTENECALHTAPGCLKFSLLSCCSAAGASFAFDTEPHLGVQRPGGSRSRCSVCRYSVTSVGSVEHGRIMLIPMQFIGGASSGKRILPRARLIICGKKPIGFPATLKSKRRI